MLSCAAHLECIFLSFGCRAASDQFTDSARRDGPRLSLRRVWIRSGLFPRPVHPSATGGYCGSDVRKVAALLITSRIATSGRCGAAQSDWRSHGMAAPRRLNGLTGHSGSANRWRAQRGGTDGRTHGPYNSLHLVRKYHRLWICGDVCASACFIRHNTISGVTGVLQLDARPGATERDVMLIRGHVCISDPT